MYRNNGNYPYLSPIIATVNITISTIEALTSRTYGKMLTLKQQEDQGKGNADISPIGNTFNQGLNFAKEFFTGQKSNG